MHILRLVQRLELECNRGVQNGGRDRSGNPPPAPDSGEDDDLDLEDGDDALDDALIHLDELMVEDPEEALATFRALPPEVQALPEFRLSLAHIQRNLGDLAATRSVLTELLAEEPDYADAHHLLGDALEDLGEAAQATKHFLRTLELDRLAASEIPEVEVAALLDETMQHLTQVMRELPAEFHARLSNVPLLVERLPSESMVREGLDPRALGVFEGQADEHLSGPNPHSVPTRIILFADNLAAEYGDPDDFAAEVRVTVLHEIGHFFGLEEDDMVRLGLD